MAGDSPAVIVFDINGNPIGSVSDGVFYRLQTDTRITDGISTVGISDVAGQKALKVDVIKTVSSGGVGTGGTSSNYLDPFPIAGTAAGFTDGYYMQGAKVFDLDSSINTEYVLGVNLRTLSLGGSVEIGTTLNPLITDVTDRNARDLGLTNRSGTANITSITAAITDTLLISSNVARRGLMIYNDSNSPLRISLGTSAASMTNFSNYLPSQTSYTLDPNFYGEIRGIWETATGFALVTELT